MMGNIGGQTGDDREVGGETFLPRCVVFGD